MKTPHSSIRAQYDIRHVVHSTHTKHVRHIAHDDVRCSHL